MTFDLKPDADGRVAWSSVDALRRFLPGSDKWNEALDALKSQCVDTPKNNAQFELVENFAKLFERLGNEEMV